MDTVYFGILSSKDKKLMYTFISEIDQRRQMSYLNSEYLYMYIYFMKSSRQSESMKLIDTILNLSILEQRSLE